MFLCIKFICRISFCKGSSAQVSCSSFRRALQAWKENRTLFPPFLRCRIIMKASWDFCLDPQETINCRGKKSPEFKKMNYFKLALSAVCDVVWWPFWWIVALWPSLALELLLVCCTSLGFDPSRASSLLGGGSALLCYRFCFDFCFPLFPDPSTPLSSEI